MGWHVAHVACGMGLAWGWHDGVGIGLASGWRRVGIGLASGRMGFAWGSHGVRMGSMAGLGNNPVQVLSTGRANHWEFLRLWTGFELSSSWTDLPCYGLYRNRNILDFL
jgi:hypothetical protein